MKNLDYLLKEKGLKNTVPRQIIYDVFCENEFEHLTAKELLVKVQKKDKSIGLATVYRNLDTLISLNLISVIENKYELITEDKSGIHPHFICENCKEVIFVGNSPIVQDILSEFAKENNFKISPSNFAIYGICSNCQKKLKTKN